MGKYVNLDLICNKSTIDRQFTIFVEVQLCAFARLLSLLGRYFYYILTKKTTMFTVLCTQNTEAYVYVIGSLILCKHILLSLTLKENTI